jgi:hypothetical protein
LSLRLRGGHMCHKVEVARKKVELFPHQIYLLEVELIV